MEQLLSLQFFQNALYASVLSAIICGIIGPYIVIRRIVFVGGGITHASFGGLGLGLYLNINPILTACVTSILAALGIDRLSRYTTMRDDSAIASIWSLGMAIGVLFMALTPGYTAGLSSYLFGNILLVSHSDLIVLAILACVLILIFLRFYKIILYTLFDLDFAETKGIPGKTINLLMLILVALALVLSIRIVGIMLLMSLLTLPQNTISLFTSDFKKLIFGSIGISLIGNVAGLFLSTYWVQVPAGVMIILVLFAILGLAYPTKWIMHRLSSER